MVGCKPDTIVIVGCNPWTPRRKYVMILQFNRPHSQVAPKQHAESINGPHPVRQNTDSTSATELPGRGHNQQQPPSRSRHQVPTTRRLQALLESCQAPRVKNADAGPGTSHDTRATETDQPPGRRGARAAASEGHVRDTVDEQHGVEDPVEGEQHEDVHDVVGHHAECAPPASDPSRSGLTGS